MNKLNKYSKTVTQDPTQPAAQAMLYAIGFKDEDFYKPPESEYSRANSLLFYTLTKRMKVLWE